MTTATATATRTLDDTTPVALARFVDRIHETTDRDELDRLATESRYQARRLLEGGWYVAFHDDRETFSILPHVRLNIGDAYQLIRDCTQTAAARRDGPGTARPPRTIADGKGRSLTTTLDGREAVALVRAAGQPFGLDLLAKLDRDGRLSRAQWFWVYRLAEQQRAADGAAQPEPGPLRDVRAMLTAAAAHKHRPSIRVETESAGRLVLALAGPRSRHAGQVLLTDGGRYPGNRYYGRIDPAGRLVPGRDLDDRMRAVLDTLAADPLGYLAEQGRASGVCCFCGRDLTTDASLAAGYGPRCAAAHDLPWGHDAHPEPEPEPGADA